MSATARCRQVGCASGSGGDGLIHLHNAITEAGGGEALSVRQVLGDVVPAFERLRQQGKTRFLGLTAIGDTTAERHRALLLGLSLARG